MLLGASNLVRGLHVLLRTAGRSWRPDLEVMGAIGLGRSYGWRSSVLGRVLPSILESGLWGALEQRPRVPTRAVVTDVGNDILYNAPVDDILAWVATCVSRLQALGADVMVTGLPLARAERVSAAGYAMLRALVFPRHRWLPRAEAVARVRAVDAGLRRVAAEAGATFLAPDDEWYGLDPIHIRMGAWSRAWAAILDGGAAEVSSARSSGGMSIGALTALRLAATLPERQWLLGFEQRRRQPSLTLPGGMSVWLY